MSTQLETEKAAPKAGTTELSYREAINAALEDELDGDPTVVFMGEDVANAGGVFKTNEGLVEKFGRERIFEGGQIVELQPEIPVTPKDCRK